MSYELGIRNYELRITNYELRGSNYEFGLLIGRGLVLDLRFLYLILINKRGDGVLTHQTH